MANVIVRNTEILGVRPVFRGMRVPADILFENLEDGLWIDEIIASYPGLDRSGVIACLEAVRANLVVEVH